MSDHEAIEIIVNYVEVMDEGLEKDQLCDIINHDFHLNQHDVIFLNEYIQKEYMPFNIINAFQVLMK